MADTKLPQDWFKDVEALSRQYWSAWTDLAQKAGVAQPPAPDPTAPWQQGVEQWMRLFGGPSAAGAAQNEALERLTAGAKSYLALLQSMAGAAASQGPNAGVAAWTEALKQGFNLPGLDPRLLNNPIAANLRDMLGQGAKGFEQYMGEFAKHLPQLQQEWQSTLKLPTFGLAREHQERWQKLALAMAAYQEHTNRYNALLLKASERGFERFQAKLAEREEPGRQLETVRQVYDLWVDGAEEAYAEIALSDEFRSAYGAMVNAQMQVRSLIQQEVENSTGQLGIPTRSEMRSVEKSLQQLKRAAKERAESSDTSALAAEVAALREELAALKKQVGGAKKSAAARSSRRKAVKSSKE